MEREYTSHLKDSDDAEGMVEAGVVDGALDIYAQRGEWEKVFEIAGKAGGDQLNRYAFPFMQQMLEKGAFRSVVPDCNRGYVNVVIGRLQANRRMWLRCSPSMASPLWRHSTRRTRSLFQR